MRFTGAVLLAAACSLAAITTARAADMPRKAPVPVPQGAFVSGSGIYLGFGTEMAVASGSISGSILPSLTGGGITADGGRIGFDVGYIKSACIMGTWCQVEVDAKWQNISGGNAAGSIQSTWSVSAEFDVGANIIQTALSQFGQSLPFPTFGAGFDPTQLLPGWVKTTGTPRQYLGGIVEAYGISGSAIGTQSGQTVTFAPGLVTGWRWQELNAAGQPINASVNVGFKYEWLDKGFDVTGILSAPGGAPPAIQRGGGQLNQLAAAFVKVDMGVGSGL